MTTSACKIILYTETCMYFQLERKGHVYIIFFSDQIDLHALFQNEPSPRVRSCKLLLAHVRASAISARMSHPSHPVHVLAYVCASPIYFISLLFSLLVRQKKIFNDLYTATYYFYNRSYTATWHLIIQPSIFTNIRWAHYFIPLDLFI